jgi:hypothetical protein
LGNGIESDEDNVVQTDLREDVDTSVISSSPTTAEVERAKEHANGHVDGIAIDDSVPSGRQLPYQNGAAMCVDQSHVQQV